ncbi:MAG TPA: hypothetical protein VKT25_12165 [Ktedonobacteraceae bacterium]|nr:hypothetical protein [Ktedonobacteraceae bacterium]
MNTAAYYIAIVLGIVAIIVGYLYLNNMVLGYHPTRGYAGLGVGVVLLIIGIVGLVMARRRTSDEV